MPSFGVLCAPVDGAGPLNAGGSLRDHSERRSACRMISSRLIPRGRRELRVFDSCRRPPKRKVLSLGVKDLPRRGRYWLLGELEPPTTRTPPHIQIDRVFQPGSIHPWVTARQTSCMAFDGPASSPTPRSISAGNRDKFALAQGRNSVEGDPMPRSEHYALPLGYREVWRFIGQIPREGTKV